MWTIVGKLIFIVAPDKIYTLVREYSLATLRAVVQKVLILYSSNGTSFRKSSSDSSAEKRALTT